MSVWITAAFSTVAFLMSYGVTHMVTSLSDWVDAPQLSAALFLVFVGLMFVVGLAGLVATAKASLREDREGGARLSVYGPLAAVGTLVFGFLGAPLLSARDWVPEYWELARGNVATPTLTVSDDGTRLSLRGRIHLGLTARVMRALEENPAIRLLELDSPGGYAYEGLALARALLERPIDTFVPKRCASACVTIFAAGQRRLLSREATLVLHSAEGGGDNEDRRLDDDHAEILRAQGVQTWLIEGERDTPFESSWEVGPLTLLASGLVTDIWEGRSPN